LSSLSSSGEEEGVRRRCKPVVVVEETCSGMECGVESRPEEEEKAAVETCSGKVVTWVGSGGDVVVSTLV
jgi:hypothetical protein